MTREWWDVMRDGALRLLRHGEEPKPCAFAYGRDGKVTIAMLVLDKEAWSEALHILVEQTGATEIAMVSTGWMSESAVPSDTPLDEAKRRIAAGPKPHDDPKRQPVCIFQLKTRVGIYRTWVSHFDQVGDHGPVTYASQFREATDARWYSRYFDALFTDSR